MSNRRFVYNRVLEKIKTKQDTIDFYKLRNKYVIYKNNKDNVEDWQLQTPKDIRASAIRDLVKNYKSAFALLKRKQIPTFKIQFQSKKKNPPALEIPKTAISINKDGELFIYKRYCPSKIKYCIKDFKKK